MSYIFEEFRASFITAAQLDMLLAEGWRHFGAHFFRYSHTMHEGKVCHVLPLRIRLEQFSHSKSQRKILKKLDGLTCRLQPLAITPAHEELFHIHSQRFESNVPESIYVFIDKNTKIPIAVWECAIYHDNRLIASSFVDIGQQSVSSIYGMFNPEYDRYSLGIATMLLEIDYAMRHKKLFYYHGYCYNVPSHYDYKKRFNALEAYHWEKGWEAYSP